MKKISIVSWNVNGLRAIFNKGFLDWFEKESADIYCLQETKLQQAQIPKELESPLGFYSTWAFAKKKGYSGVVTYSREKPLLVEDLNENVFDSEGRTQVLTFKDFILINAYFPNSQEKGKRLDYKLAYCKEILELCNRYKKQKKNIILCGDLNIAHKAIDLTYPERNEENPGYLPEERAWLDRFVKAGYVDTFRMFNQDPGHYTWWSYRTRARLRDIGWRLDYFFCNKEFVAKVKQSFILKTVMGSDHCPVRLEITSVM